jgi:hypothetical protein
VGVVTWVEVVNEEEKTEASMVSESLSLSTESVEEAEDDGRDWSVDAVGEGAELSAESGVWNSSSEVASLSVSPERVRGEGLRKDLSFGKIVLIERGRDCARGSFGCGDLQVRR